MIHKLLNRIIVWNFHSLLVMIQMCFSFMLTDSDCDMKLCKHCGRAFIASRKGNEFCSPKCKNQYNVYKTRARKKGGITPIYQQRRQIINNLLTICRLLFFIISLMIFTPLLALSLQFSQFQICSFLLHLQFELIYNFYIKGMKQILFIGIRWDSCLFASAFSFVYPIANILIGSSPNGSLNSSFITSGLK